MLLAASLWGTPEKVSTPEFKPVLLFAEKTYQFIQYPDVAKEMNIKGKVRMKLEIGKDGKVTDYKVLNSAHDVLTNEVVKNLKNLYFEPACDHGQTVVSDIVISFSFGN